MAVCFFGLAVLFFLIGMVQFVAPAPKAPAPHVSPRSTVPRRPLPTQSRIPDGGSMSDEPRKFNWIKTGERIHVRHPVKGETMAHVLGRILFAELMQRGRGPQVPWTPTGNVFAGFWLEGGILLLNWQNRVYLLDDRIELSDTEITRDFLPHARKFAQSNQSADVYFAYPPAMWHVDDIGKFRIEAVEGITVDYQFQGSGRFIHASGDSRRALVVEDFEGGNGQDTVWIGYQIEEDDVLET
jgi:hypothetical protein